MHACLGDELQTRASIRIHGDKTKIWNQAGERPPICDVLERIAQQNNPRARVWRGSEGPTAQQGIKVLGTPLGHPDFIRQHLRDVSEEHERFLTPRQRCAVRMASSVALCPGTSEFLVPSCQA